VTKNLIPKEEIKMTETQTPEMQKIDSTAKEVVGLPEKFRDLGASTFHRMYQIVKNDKNGDPTMNGADAKKAAEGTVNYLIRQLQNYLGMKNLETGFLERKADSNGNTFGDLFLTHNGLPARKIIQKTLEMIIKEGKVEAVLPTLTKLAEAWTKKYLESQTGFVAGETEQNIMTNDAYQKAAQAFVKSVTGKPTDAIGEELVKQYGDAAARKYGAMHGNN